MNNLQTTKQAFTSQFKNLEQAMEVAKIVANSTFVPASMKGKEGDVLVAFMHGMEVGLKPMQALQGIAVINGRPCIWGKALLALVKTHPEFESIEEWSEGDTAFCKIKRKGQPEVVRSFSQEDAKTAGLATKAGPWRLYPSRMRQHRARGFAIADCFPDAMCGLEIVEEVRDYVVEEKPKLNEAQEVEFIIKQKEQNQKYVQQLEQLINDKKVDKSKVMEWGGVDQIENLSSKQVNEAITMISTKYGEVNG